VGDVGVNVKDELMQQSKSVVMMFFFITSKTGDILLSAC
jgi:hypothetical protein